MNIQNLLNNLHNAVAETTDPVDLLMLSKAIQRLNVGKVSTVATTAGLPATGSNEGQLYFVTADESLYWSNGQRWRPIGATLGQAWAWGRGTNGRLGDNTTANRSSPVSVVGGFTDWCQVTAGEDHSGAVRANGTAWMWGVNQYGRLGDTSQTTRLSPVSVVGGFTDWCQISAGALHSAAVRQNGTLWAWGYGGSGALGDGSSFGARVSPVSVIGGFTDWCQVSAGSGHTAAVRQNGTLWAWGDNTCGKLGDNTYNNRPSPIPVIGGFTDWCQVSGGYRHTAAVRQNGTLWAWGRGDNGQLGSNEASTKASPVSVVGGFTDWCQVAVGCLHTAAVRQNGTLWAWGLNQFGRLGDGTQLNRSSPVSVVGGFTDWCQVSAGAVHTAAVRQNGAMWAWGRNNYGQLGDCTTVNKSYPVPVVGTTFGDWCQVAVGNYHNIALLAR